MTIFDALRYSNVDIFSSEKLNMLPRDLLEAWITICLEDVNYPDELPGAARPYIDFSLIVRNITFIKIMRCRAGPPTNDILRAIIKSDFTKLLKKMIAEYEHHTV